MALKTMGLSLVAIIVTLLCTGSAAQSTSCTNELISMSPCLNYITGNSSTPSSSCCSQLSSVVKSSPKCLCQVLNGGGSQLGMNINQTQALQLPKACNVQTPPVSQCNVPPPPPLFAADTPTAPSDTPTTSTPGNNGSKTVPSPNVDTTNGSSHAMPSILLLAILLVASYASTSGSF
ncbi:hypothetical protein ACHQM5_027482 [Ranunculus cassubicifolius]